MVLEDHPGLEDREEEGCGNATKETSKEQHVEVVPQLCHTRYAVQHPKDHPHCLASTAWEGKREFRKRT